MPVLRNDRPMVPLSFSTSLSLVASFCFIVSFSFGTSFSFAASPLSFIPAGVAKVKAAEEGVEEVEEAV